MTTPKSTNVLELEHTRVPEAEPARAIRHLVSAALDRSGMSRAEVAVELTNQVGERVTEAMLNDWSSQSKRRLRFPAAFVPAFCQVTGTDELARFLLTPRLRRLLALAEQKLDVLAFAFACDIAAEAQELARRKKIGLRKALRRVIRARKKRSACRK